MKIHVDSVKCPDAFECLKCLHTCRSRVLLVIPAGNPFGDRGKGQIQPAVTSQCTGCGDCQRVCPAGAIRIEM